MLVTSGDDDSSSGSESPLAPDDVMDKRPIPRWLGCGVSCLQLSPVHLPSYFQKHYSYKSSLHKYFFQGMIEPQ